jgi:acyl-CoA thioesterase FadM
LVAVISLVQKHSHPGSAGARLGKTRLTTTPAVRREAEVIVEGDVRYVFVDASTRRATLIPARVRYALARFQLEDEPKNGLSG